MPEGRGARVDSLDAGHCGAIREPSVRSPRPPVVAPVAGPAGTVLADRIRKRFVGEWDGVAAVPTEPSSGEGDGVPGSTKPGGPPAAPTHLVPCLTWAFPGSASGWTEGIGTTASAGPDGLALVGASGAPDVRSPTFSLPKRRVAEMEVAFRADFAGTARIWFETESTGSTTPRPSVDLSFSPPFPGASVEIRERIPVTGVLGAMPGESLVGLILRWRRAGLESAPSSVLLREVSLRCVSEGAVDVRRRDAVGVP